VLLATATSEADAISAIKQMTTLLEQNNKSKMPTGASSTIPKSIHSASNRDPNAQLALISVPGEYAGLEAWNALSEDLHVHLFSDNVPVEIERELKLYGHENEKLVMGPDCGTAIIDGLKLGFTNEVPNGSIGVIAASGTGLQAVTSRLARKNVGISQAVGTGSRDLSDSINGLTTRTALSELDKNDMTDVIVIISKPPGDSTIPTIEKAIQDCTTPVVVHFQGAESLPENATSAETLAGTADKAIEVADINADALATKSDGSSQPTIQASNAEDSGYIRGLFTGGTLCSEAALLFQQQKETVRTNIGIGDPIDKELDPNSHTFIDFGTDDFTESHPHPMIEPSLRNGWIESALQDNSTAVVLIDIVLGYGAHEDPAGTVANLLSNSASDTHVVASVCGTNADPQPRSEQVSVLEDAGVIVAESNAEATRLAYQITSPGEFSNPGGVA
jgi:succinyl-CoA synthetase alpha subunit